MKIHHDIEGGQKIDGEQWLKKFFLIGKIVEFFDSQN